MRFLSCWYPVYIFIFDYLVCIPACLICCTQFTKIRDFRKYLSCLFFVFFTVSVAEARRSQSECWTQISHFRKGCNWFMTYGHVCMDTHSKGFQPHDLGFLLQALKCCFALFIKMYLNAPLSGLLRNNGMERGGEGNCRTRFNSLRGSGIVNKGR